MHIQELNLIYDIIDKTNDGFLDDLSISTTNWVYDVFGNIDMIPELAKDLNDAIINNKTSRILFFTHVIQDSSDLKKYELFYNQFLIFINDFLDSSDSNHEFILSQILDILWHQESQLKDLGKEFEINLFNALSNICDFKIDSDESQSELFHGINKSMDLIKYQTQYGNSDILIDKYLSHNNKYISERAKEYKNWL